MTWWKNVKFGMFIHWEVYAMPVDTYGGNQIGGIGNGL